MNGLRRLIVAGLATATGPATAATLDLEAATDLRRRGIGWSSGRPALEAVAAVPIGSGLSLVAGAATLRDSPRHGGADLLAEGGLRYTIAGGPWQGWAEVIGHGFIGGEPGRGYGEVRGGTAFGFGPAQFLATIGYSPPQGAIGGSNLALGARAALAIIGTPLTLAIGVGHSTGTSDGSGRSNRLRPGGAYSDGRIDADYVVGPVTLGISLVATTITAETRTIDPAFAADTGTRVLLRAGVAF